MSAIQACPKCGCNHVDPLPALYETEEGKKDSKLRPPKILLSYWTIIFLLAAYGCLRLPSLWLKIFGVLLGFIALAQVLSLFSYRELKRKWQNSVRCSSCKKVYETSSVHPRLISTTLVSTTFTRLSKSACRAGVMPSAKQSK